jgi:hypothetical protein
MQTALRAVSAREALTPLAVLVPILAMLVGAAWAFTFFPPLAFLVIGAGLAATAAAGRRTYGARTSLVAAACSVPAAFVAFWLWWAVAVNASICGKNVSTGWIVLACIAGALVFFAVGSFGLRTYRATSIVPLGLLAAVLAMLLVFAVAPGTHSFCGVGE